MLKEVLSLITSLRKKLSKENLNLFVNIAMLIFAVLATISANDSAEIAQKSLDSLNESIKWYKEPQPLLVYSTNFDYIENRTIDLDIVPAYTGINTSPWTLATPIRVTLYNSGRAPWISAKLYINLTADKINTTFPFKIYRVVTPIDKIFYNETDRKMYQSYDLLPVFRKEGKIDVPLLRQDYPPYIENGRVTYPMLFNSFNTLSEWKAVQKKTPSSGLYQNDSFGPFRLGTIEPDNKVEIEVWLFAIPMGEYFGQYNLGNLNLFIESEKTEGRPVNISINFPLISGPLIDVPSEAIGRVAIDKTTGKILEFQSGARYPDGSFVPLGTLKQNAINAGYLLENVEEKYINQSEYNRLTVVN